MTSSHLLLGTLSVCMLFCPVQPAYSQTDKDYKKLERAQRKAEIGDLAKAEEIYNELISQYPKWEAPLWEMLAITWDQERLTEALRYGEACLEANPHNMEAVHMMGRILARKDSQQEARLYYEKLPIYPIPDVPPTLNCEVGQNSMALYEVTKKLPYLLDAYERFQTIKEAVDVHRDLDEIKTIAFRRYHELEKEIDFESLSFGDLDKYVTYHPGFGKRMVSGNLPINLLDEILSTFYYHPELREFLIYVHLYHKISSRKPIPEESSQVNDEIIIYEEKINDQEYIEEKNKRAGYYMTLEKLVIFFPFENCRFDSYGENDKFYGSRGSTRITRYYTPARFQCDCIDLNKVEEVKGLLQNNFSIAVRPPQKKPGCSFETWFVYQSNYINAWNEMKNSVRDHIIQALKKGQTATVDDWASWGERGEGKTEGKNALSCFEYLGEEGEKIDCNRKFPIHKVKCGNGKTKYYYHVPEDSGILCAGAGYHSYNNWGVAGGDMGVFLSREKDRAMKKLCDCQ